MGQNWKRRMQLLRLNDAVFGAKLSLNCQIKYKLLINKGVKWCGRRAISQVRFLMEEPEAPKYKQDQLYQ